MNNADSLLIEVLRICRNKGGISTQSWHNLKGEIENHLQVAEINYKPLVYKQIESRIHLKSMVDLLKTKIKTLNQTIKKYQQREADALKVLGRKIY